jgi:TolA-binding protein
MLKLLGLQIMVAILVVSGCAVPVAMMPDNMTDENKSGPVGFDKRVIAPNLYRLSYTTPAFTVLNSYENAWNKWQLKAGQICQNESFQVRDKVEKKWTGSAPGWLQTVTADLDCTGHALEEFKKAETMRAAQDREELKTLANGPVCQNGPAANLFELAQKFYKGSYYKQAMSCFLKVIEAEPQNSEAILHVGMMYEFGYGVAIDIETAKSWYAKMQ